MRPSTRSKTMQSQVPGWLGSSNEHTRPPATIALLATAEVQELLEKESGYHSSPMTRNSPKRSTKDFLSPSTDLCSPFDVRTCRCNNRTTPGAGPSKAAQKPKKHTLKTPLEPAKKRWSRTPHLCSPNWSGGTVRTLPRTPNNPTDARENAQQRAH
jgi:hypothetical protein